MIRSINSTAIAAIGSLISNVFAAMSGGGTGQPLGEVGRLTHLGGIRWLLS